MSGETVPSNIKQSTFQVDSCALGTGESANLYILINTIEKYYL